MARLNPEERRERARILRNASLVGAYGKSACRALVARGVGPDTAVRILQKVSEPQSPVFWREVLEAECTFARTNAYWRK